MKESDVRLSADHSRALGAVVLYGMGIVAERGVAILMLPLITGYLTPGEFGVVSLLYLTANVSSYFVMTPLTLGLSRFYHAPDYAGRREVLLTTLATLLVIKATVIAAAYFAASNLLCGWLELGTQNIEAVQSYTLVLWLTSLPALPLLLLQLRQRPRRAIVCSVTGAFCGAAATAYLLIVADAGIRGVIYGQAVQLAATSLLAWPAYVSQMGGRLSFRTAAEPLKWGYSLLPASYSTLMIDSVDRYFVAHYLGVGVAGIYDFGYRLSAVISVLLVQPAKKGLHPLLLKLERDPDAQRELIRSTVVYFYIIASFVAILFSIFAKEIVRLASSQDSYRAAWVVIPIVAFAYVQNGIGQFLNYGIVMTKRAFCNTAIMLLSALVNIVLNILWIPRFGLIGAAFATLVCYIVWNALKIYFSRKYYDLEFDLRRLGHISAVAAATVGGALAITEVAVLSAPAALAVKFAFVAFFPATLAATGFFTAAERRTMGYYATVLVQRGVRFAGRSWALLSRERV